MEEAVNVASPAESASMIWHTPPPDSLEGREICLFVSYAPSGELKPHVARYLAGLREQGFFLIALVAVDNDLKAPVDRTAWETISDAFAARQNAGFDFGAWAAVLNTHPQLWQAVSLTLANDSVFGPFDGFAEMIDRTRRSDADVIGLIETLQQKRHFQSFFMTFKNKALASPVLQSFWKEVRNIEDKTELIRQYEVELLSLCETAGLHSEILFPLSLLERRSFRYRDLDTQVLNPTHHLWSELLQAGFPFIKIEPLRDNPCRVYTKGWQQRVADRGADVEMIEKCLNQSWAERGYGSLSYDMKGVMKRKLKRIRRAIREKLGIPAKTRRPRKSPQ